MTAAGTERLFDWWPDSPNRAASSPSRSQPIGKMSPVAIHLHAGYLSIVVVYHGCRYPGIAKVVDRLHGNGDGVCR